jgi:hypothetical protein
MLIFSQADPDLGLIKRAYATDHEFDPTGKRTQWERFANYVRHLDATAPKAISYKVLFLGRHGEGWHNVEEADVGGKLWDVSWQKIRYNNTSLTVPVLLVTAGWKRKHHLGQCRTDTIGREPSAHSTRLVEDGTHRSQSPATGVVLR